jgi:hypothetical protein
MNRVFTGMTIRASFADVGLHPCGGQESDIHLHKKKPQRDDSRYGFAYCFLLMAFV